MFQEALRDIQSRVDAALSRSARQAEAVRIMAVTKTVPPEKIMEAYQAGHRLFGENRVQELEKKKNELPDDIEWHFIGHLQTNKVKKIVGEAAMIQSIDSARLALAVSQEAKKKGCIVPVLLEINTSGETSKFGFNPENFEAELDKIQALPGLDFRGLMTIGPWVDEVKGDSECRTAFEVLRELKDKVEGRFENGKFRELSMGMSHDFEIAIEEGSTMIRIGTYLFGERQ